MPPVWLEWSFFALTVAALGWNVIIAIRLRRAIRQCNAKLQEAFNELQQVRALRLLLADICARAFWQQHLPIWRPWSIITGISFRIVPMDQDKAKD